VSPIYWNTHLFVYWLEDKGPYSQYSASIHRRMTKRGDTLCTSAFTLAELLVAPQKQNDKQLTEKIIAYFSGPNLLVLPFDRSTALSYALVRSSCKVSLVDAIHLSSASAEGVDLFLANDNDVRKLIVPGIQFIDGLETTVLG
jgi:predicted nucleic acid-binding protein